MIVRIPKLSLVVLIGASGSGKSSFARRHFRATEILSSDTCRGWVRDNENDQSASADAFDVLHYVARKRLAAGLLTVVDATNVRAEDRKHLVELAREHHVLPAAIVFDLPESVCHERNAQRPDRAFGPHVVRQQTQAMHRSLRGLGKEGFRHIAVFRSVADVDAATVERERLWNDKRDEHGPFDIIGDVHGCHDELLALLDRLGYAVAGTRDAPVVTPPEGRRAIFLGDLVDRGPDSPSVLKLAMRMVADGTALCVPGNHDVKLMRKLNGRDVQITHGLAETLQQLENENDAFKRDVATFVDGLVSHYVLDDGKLVVAHAGMKESMQGRGSGAVRQFALYGESTGEIDEYGLPVRYEWARDYRGSAAVVYGHTPVPEAEWVNRTICIDTACVFGGKLTALRWPERELVSVPALKTWYEPIRPIAPEAPQRDAMLLDIGDVAGKRVVSTRVAPPVTIREENAHAALEVMSRFAIDPRWLVYLPPTMAPPATAADGAVLERPQEAFAYYRNEGVDQLVCQEKHMGSRAVVVLCRDEATARARFGIAGFGRGIIHTRSGRRFFNDDALEAALLDRLDAALGASGLWEELRTDWIIIDAELMPWSAKAQELLRQQYAPTGAAGGAAMAEAQALLARAAQRVPEASALRDAMIDRRDALARYGDAYRRYCWPVDGINGLRLAPFHILACEGMVGLTRDHRWQMDTLARLCAADPALLHATRHRYVDLGDAASVDAATAWWHELTDAGGEGMVVKPVAALVRGSRGLVQPAIKCRGSEYLRIIYGPEYLLPQHLDRLRSRGLGAKRSLAAREFALGVEALHRFVEREPLYRVHECVFGVLALESEPVDARL